MFDRHVARAQGVRGDEEVAVDRPLSAAPHDHAAGAGALADEASPGDELPAAVHERDALPAQADFKKIRARPCPLNAGRARRTGLRTHESVHVRDAAAILERQAAILVAAHGEESGRRHHSAARDGEPRNVRLVRVVRKLREGFADEDLIVADQLRPASDVRGRGIADQHPPGMDGGPGVGRECDSASEQDRSGGGIESAIADGDRANSEQVHGVGTQERAGYRRATTAEGEGIAVELEAGGISDSERGHHQAVIGRRGIENDGAPLEKNGVSRTGCGVDTIYVVANFEPPISLIFISAAGANAAAVNSQPD